MKHFHEHNVDFNMFLSEKNIGTKIWDVDTQNESTEEKHNVHYVRGSYGIGRKELGWLWNWCQSFNFWHGDNRLIEFMIARPSNGRSRYLSRKCKRLRNDFFLYKMPIFQLYKSNKRDFTRCFAFGVQYDLWSSSGFQKKRKLAAVATSIFCRFHKLSMHNNGKQL